MSEVDAAQREAFVAQLAGPVCDALVVVSGDEIVVDWSSGRVHGPIDTMSITKSVVSMVLGRLFREGVLGDLDVRISEMLPAWRGTPRERITLRQVMSHTSGLDATPTSEDVFASGDVVRFALGLDLVSEPGDRFAYNNAAVNLLSAVVETAAGRPLDRVAEELLFEPLDIRSYRWRRDAAGTPLSMSGCALEPLGLVRLGQLMAAGGTWRGRELLASEWCRVSTAPAPPASPTDLQRFLRGHALLWWVLYSPDESFALDDEVIRAWREADPPMEAAVLERLAPLAGAGYRKDALLAAVAAALSPLTDGDEDAALEVWHENTWRRGLPDVHRMPGAETGFSAQGARGQHLLVVPDRRLVVVQMVGERSRPAEAMDLLDAASRLFA